MPTKHTYHGMLKQALRLQATSSENQVNSMGTHGYSWALWSKNGAK